MTPREWATWLSSALFLLQAPGCLSLSCTSQVTGTVGGSLSVRCRYEEEFKGNNKYWCESPCPPLIKKKVVETTESERAVRRGRVSIRDDPATLTFTVTLENLTEEDEGTYWCGIDVLLLFQRVDHTFPVMVSVSPAPEPTWKTFPRTLGPFSYLPASTSPSTTSTSSTTSMTSTSRLEIPDPNQHPRSLFSSVHFRLLVFLKLPLFLSMLGAVLWVNRPQRGSVGSGKPHSQSL